MAPEALKAVAAVEHAACLAFQACGLNFGPAAAEILQG